MMYTQLGRTGVRVSRLALGTVNFGGRVEEPEAHRLMDHALDHLHTGAWDFAILWTLRDVERTCRFYEAAGWYRDGEEKVWEIPKGNTVSLVRYRFDLH